MLGEAGRRDRASRLACLSLAGLSWPTTGLSLGSPRRWKGARTSAGGWGTPLVAASRSHGRKAQQGTLAPAFPCMERLPTRRTASTRRGSFNTSQPTRALESAPRRSAPRWVLNSAAGHSFYLKARPWPLSFAGTLRIASCCLKRPRTINRAGRRARVSEGPWQRANDWKVLRDGRKRW